MEETLKAWARAYRDSPQYRFPCDPHAEFFPIDMENAAAEIERLRAAGQAVLDSAMAIEGDAMRVRVPRTIVGRLRAALNLEQKEDKS